MFGVGLGFLEIMPRCFTAPCFVCGTSVSLLTCLEVSIGFGAGASRNECLTALYSTVVFSATPSAPFFLTTVAALFICAKVCVGL